MSDSIEKITGFVERARLTDVPQIQELINHFADQDTMLHRSLSEIYEGIRGFVVCHDEEGNIAGCALLQTQWEDEAELKSVAVYEKYQGCGYGKTLVRACLKEAPDLGVSKVYLLAYQSASPFFAHLGFIPVDMKTLPRKLWGECRSHCPKSYPSCGEIPMILHVPPTQQTA